jgi:hypothetical protein
MLNVKVVTWALGTFTAMSFVLCVLYGLVLPGGHMREFLELVLPAFRWLTLPGFVLGLVESFLYGAYAGIVYAPVYNFFQRRWARVGDLS